MAGSTPFLIEDTENFKRSFKKLAKNYKTNFVDQVEDVLESLIDDQYPLGSRDEPLPGNIKLPESWTFHKVEIKVGKGASGQVRLIYLVNATTCIIKLVWIYSHEQFVKRPADRDLKNVIKDILGC